MALKEILSAKLAHNHYVVTVFLFASVALLLFTGSYIAAISILTSSTNAFATVNS